MIPLTSIRRTFTPRPLREIPVRDRARIVIGLEIEDLGLEDGDVEVGKRMVHEYAGVNIEVGKGGEERENEGVEFLG